jgi:hypothetical protein
MKHLKRISYYGGVVALACMSATAQATVVLYDQNFENPTGFVNDGGDVNIFRTVNQLYGNQPPGFTFAQANTVETLYINGTSAFGTGYSDPSGKGGNYALGMLSSVQNDLLGLAFDVGTFDYLNVRLDISSIDLSVFGGPFVTPGALPVFSFTLYDNPTGVAALGGGTPLASAQATGTASARDVFDWTEVLLGLDATGSTNGKVILRIDLLEGGYASLDNIRIVASNTAGDIGEPGDGGTVPLPGTLSLLGLGLLGLGAMRRKAN